MTMASEISRHPCSEHRSLPSARLLSDVDRRQALWSQQRQSMLGFAVHPPTGTSFQAEPVVPRVVAIIPARYGSTRLPGKPLAQIDGRSMVEHVYRRVSTAESVSTVLVATDDERIAHAVTGFGGEARMTRTDHLTGTDRLAEVAETIDCDIVVNVQADEPLIAPTMINDVVAACEGPDVMMSTLRCPLRDLAALHDPNVVKIAVDREGTALFFSRAAIGLDRNSHRFPATTVDKHIGIYAYRRGFLLTLSRLEPTPLERMERLEQLRVLEHGYRIMTTRTEQDPVGVDTPADLARVRRLVSTGAHA